MDVDRLTLLCYWMSCQVSFAHGKQAELILSRLGFYHQSPLESIRQTHSVLQETLRTHTGLSHRAPLLREPYLFWFFILPWTKVARLHY